MRSRENFIRQHERLRVPKGWEEQDKALIIQLNRLLDDIYARFDTKYDANGKADKVVNATAGNFAGLDADGNLTDSGKKPEDYAGKSEAIKNITRSGTTFTATKADGTTFTFTQQDNDHYAWADITGKPSYYDGVAIKDITRSGTTFTATKMDGTTFTFTQQDNNTDMSTKTTVVKQISRGANFDPIQSGYFAGMTTSSGIDSNWWHILSMDWSGDDKNNWISQLALPTEGRRGIRYRTRQNSTTSEWFTCLDSTNYTSYAADRTAVTGVSRSGTTFTATRANGTTFTFTQQDNNTWRGIQNNLTSTATDQSLSAAQGKALKGMVDNAPRVWLNAVNASGSVTNNTANVALVFRNDVNAVVFPICMQKGNDSYIFNASAGSLGKANWNTSGVFKNNSSVSLLVVFIKTGAAV